MSSASSASQLGVNLKCRALTLEACRPDPPTCLCPNDLDYNPSLVADRGKDPRERH